MVENRKKQWDDNSQFSNRRKKWGVDLRALKFLYTLRGDCRLFVVIGLGRFGRAVCETLHKLGYEVLGADVDEKLVTQVLAERIVTNAVQLDSTEPTALREAGIFEVETVIVAIGNYLEESIITTLNLKEAGVKYVVAKASTEIHGKLLKRVGADQVIFPEYEAGAELAYMLTQPAILERFELDPDTSIVEIIVPEEFDGKTLAELQLRSHYGLNVLAIGMGEKFVINPPPKFRLQRQHMMVVIGLNRDIQRLPI